MNTFDRERERELVRDANPIVDVIQEYITLERDGHRFKARCPFHKEKTPSFKVDPQRESFHCFGCGERGDAFSFVMKYESLGFPAALQRLADRAGIELSTHVGGQRRDPSGVSDRHERRVRAHELLEFATRWFRQQLAADSGAAARDYLEARAFTAADFERFQIGYAPANWTALVDALGGQHGDAVPRRDLALELGLIRQSAAGRCYDAYRDRIVFPIRNLQGKVVGFGGRIRQTADGEPKYINSPESELFKKGKLLYGHFEGRESTRQSRRVLLMEGYTDVIKAHAHGFDNAVATLGTALTEQNAESLARYADQTVLVFDGDSAGRRAAINAIGLMLPQPVDVRVALLPVGQDPCDLLSDTDGAQRFQRAIDSAQEALAFALHEFANEHDAPSDRAKQRIAEQFFALLPPTADDGAKARTGDLSAIRLEVALEQLAQALDVRVSAVQTEFARWNTQRRPSRRSASPLVPAGQRVAPDRAGDSTGPIVAEKPSNPADERGSRPAARSARNGRDRPGLYLEEAFVLRVALSSPERAQIILALHPPEVFAFETFRILARRLHVKGAPLEAIELDEPDHKAVLLELQERIEQDPLDEARAAQLLRDLVRRSLERCCERIQTTCARQSALVGDAQGRHRDRMILKLQELRSEVLALRASRKGDWSTLYAKAERQLDVRAEVDEMLERFTVTSADLEFNRTNSASADELPGTMASGDTTSATPSGHDRVFVYSDGPDGDGRNECR